MVVGWLARHVKFPRLLQSCKYRVFRLEMIFMFWWMNKQVLELQQFDSLFAWQLWPTFLSSHIVCIRSPYFLTFLSPNNGMCLADFWATKSPCFRLMFLTILFPWHFCLFSCRMQELLQPKHVMTLLHLDESWKPKTCWFKCIDCRNICFNAITSLPAGLFDNMPLLQTLWVHVCLWMSTPTAAFMQ